MDQAAHQSFRVFFAIELAEQVRRRAVDHIAELRSRMPQARVSWERPEKLHLTLKFLGAIEESRVRNLKDAAQRAVGRVQPFDLSVEGVGVFPQRGGSARVLWLGAGDPSGSIFRLQQVLEDECAGEGFAREPRPFHPHLTIARLRRPEDARRLAALHLEKGFTPEGFLVNELVLIKSEPGPGGTLYTELSRHGLGAK